MAMNQLKNTGLRDTIKRLERSEFENINIYAMIENSNKQISNMGRDGIEY